MCEDLIIYYKWTVWLQPSRILTKSPSGLENQARSYGGGGGGEGADCPPAKFFSPLPREIWEVFVIVDRREFTSTA